MPPSVACTSCGAKVRIPAYAFGRVFKCPKCGKSVTADAAPNQPTTVETVIVDPFSPFREPTPPDDVPVLELATPPDDVPVLELATPSDDIPVLELAHEGNTKARPSRTRAKPGTTAPGLAQSLQIFALRSPLAAILACGCLVVLGVMLLTICSELSSIDHRGTNVTAEMIEKAHLRGEEVGREEGWRAGEAEGFAASFNSAEKETYKETIDDLYQSRQFQRIPLYTTGVMIAFFILGFLIQWIVLYVPRRVGYLRDIDWIVLPKEMTQVDLYDLSAPLPTQSKRLKPPSAGTTLTLLLALLPLIGCKSREEDAWQQGYDANRSAAYQDGWREAAPRGEKEGKERGKAEANHAARTGRAWHLYKIPAFLALMFGIIVGLAAQYTVLACCRDAGRVPEMVTLALVPAMKHSVAYAILEGRRKLLIWWEQEKSRLTAANQLKAAQVQAVHDVVVRKLKVMTALEELTQARLLDLARAELAKVVSDAEMKAQMPMKRTVACPHCGKTIAYPRKKAGKTVTCPYANCSRPIHLPANVDEN